MSYLSRYGMLLEVTVLNVHILMLSDDVDCGLHWSYDHFSQKLK